MKKNVPIIIIISALIIFVVIIISGKSRNENQGVSSLKESTANNVNIIDGKQIIEIRAKGGYTPRKSIAKALIPTILRFDTNGTFDCSSSVRIPSMNIFKNLPQNGSTDIDLGIPKAQDLQGSCGMGMYPFEINFQ